MRKTLLHWNGFLSHVRGFGCVENEVLSTYGKNTKMHILHKKWTDRVELTKKTTHCKSRDFLRKRRLKRQQKPSTVFDRLRNIKHPESSTFK